MDPNYTEESIKSLDWREHIRIRPGMYIGKLGDGSSPDDGILLGTFEIPRSIQRGSFGVGDPNLLDFLRSKRGGSASMRCAS